MFSNVCWQGLQEKNNKLTITITSQSNHESPKHKSTIKKLKQSPLCTSPAYRLRSLNKTWEVNSYFIVWDCADNKLVNGWMGTGGRLSVDCCCFSAWLSASWRYSYSTLTLSFSHSVFLTHKSSGKQRAAIICWLIDLCNCLVAFV